MDDTTKRDHLTQGHPLDLLEAIPMRSPELCRVHVDWLLALIQPPGEVHLPIRVHNAVIREPLDLTGLAFHHALEFINCDFLAPVNLAASTLHQRTAFAACRFYNDLTLRSAEIRQELHLPAVCVQGILSLADAHVAKRLFLTGAVLGGAHFQGLRALRYVHLNYATIQGDLNFDDATIDGALICDYTRFVGRASLQALHVQGDASFRSAIFHGPAYFNRTTVGGSLIFAPVDTRPTTFHSHAMLAALSIGSQLICTAVAFNDLAIFQHTHVTHTAFFLRTVFHREARFDSFQVAGNLYLNCETQDEPAVFCAGAFFGAASIGGQVTADRVFFGSTTHFLSVRVGQDVLFRGAHFEGDTHFDRMRVERGAAFDSASDGTTTVFRGQATFGRAQFGDEVKFAGATFWGPSEWTNASVQGNAFFNRDDHGRSVRFAGRACFPGVVFGSQATFDGAHFEADADFRGAKFRGEARFKGTHFSRGAEFVAARGDNALMLQGASVEATLSLRDSVWMVLGLEDESPMPSGPPSPQIAFRKESRVDLRGCTYSRIAGDWRLLLSRQDPYHRQPYLMLEQVLRKAGYDDQADAVYYQRREKERELREAGASDRMLRMRDYLYRVIAGYGVRPMRLVPWTVTVVILGAYIFAQPGATAVGETSSRRAEQECLSVGQAIGVSIHEFVPFEVPVGGRRKVTSRTMFKFLGLNVPYSAYALLHRLSGLALIPLGLAALTGLLHRRSSAG